MQGLAANSRARMLFKSSLLLSAALSLNAAGSDAQSMNTLSLHEAVTEALQSPRARIADEQPALAKAQARQAALGLNPRLYLQSEDLHPWDNNFSFANNTEDYAYLSQTFEVDGKRSKRIALANANARRADVDREYRKRQIVAQVAAAYWTAVANREVAVLLEQDLAAVDSHGDVSP